MTPSVMIRVRMTPAVSTGKKGTLSGQPNLLVQSVVLLVSTHKHTHTHTHARQKHARTHTHTQVRQIDRPTVETDRETDRQIDSQTDKEMDREMDRETER